MDHWKYEDLEKEMRGIKNSLDDLNKSFREFNFINQGYFNKLPSAHPIIDNKRNFYFKNEDNLYDFRAFKLNSNWSFSHLFKTTGCRSDLNKSLLCQNCYERLCQNSLHDPDFGLWGTFYVDSFAIVKIKENLRIDFLRSNKIAAIVFLGMTTQYSYYNDGKCKNAGLFGTSKKDLNVPFICKEYKYEEIGFYPSWREILFDLGYCLSE